VRQHRNLSISNLTITSGDADSGGAIMVDSGGVLSLSSSTIQNSAATATSNRDGSGIGIQSALDMGYLDAIDVWGWASQGVEVCFPRKGDLVFVDASTSSRTVRSLEFTYLGGFSCASISMAGTVVLVEAGPVEASLSDEPVASSGCTTTTTDMVNMRNAPGGDTVLMGFLPGTVFAALQRATDWFQVQLRGTPGWISADFVTTQGNCD